MIRALLDRVMNRRVDQLIALIGDWLPHDGPLAVAASSAAARISTVLDLGSGTGHLADRLTRDHGLDIVTADVSDIHVVGPPPVLIAGDGLPFEDRRFSAALLLFMLAYPADPVGILSEAARVTHGPILVVQTLYAGRLGYAWLRVREFLWTVVAFHASKRIGYVPRDATFAMNTRRFYTAVTLGHAVSAAGLRITSQRERPVLPGGLLIVAAWRLQHRHRGEGES
jgi:SAM-dependent methyltransferase